MMNIQKAAVIGCGFVGASTAFSLVQKGLFSELVLIDANKEKAEGEAMDLSHGRPFVHSMKIYAGDYDDISDCALIIITAGANQKPGETRLDLVHKNVAIFKSIIPEITKRNFEGNLLIVANPVDILTYAALKISGYPKERVFGSGTVLDSARFRYLLSEHLDVDSRSVHALISEKNNILVERFQNWDVVLFLTQSGKFRKKNCIIPSFMVGFKSVIVIILV